MSKETKTVFLRLDVPRNCRNVARALAQQLANRDEEFIEGFLEELISPND